MGYVRVRRNELPRIIRAWRKEIDNGVDETARNMEDYLKPRVWLDTGVVRSTTTARTRGSLHARVGVGHHEGRGFYARFHEWGTVNPNITGKPVPARPVVGPAAHAHEPILAANVTKAILRAISG